MALNLDKKMLAGFAREVGSYVPKVRDGIERFRQDVSQPAVLEQAAQYLRNISSAAAMLTLSTLSQVATDIATAVEELLAGTLAIETDRVPWLLRSIDALEAYLTDLGQGEPDNQGITTAVEETIQGLKGLLEDDRMPEPSPALPPESLAVSEPEAEAAEDELHDLPPAAPGALDALVADIDRNVQRVYGQMSRPASPRYAVSQNAASERYLVFTLAGSRYAVLVPHIVEVGRVPFITPIPNVPVWMRGVINLRGEILSVLDLRAFLGDETSQVEHSRMLVVKTLREELVTSLIVDQVQGFVSLPRTAIQTSSTTFATRVAPYLSGVCEQHEQTLAVLDLERFLLSPEVCQFE